MKCVNKVLTSLFAIQINTNLFKYQTSFLSSATEILKFQTDRTLLLLKPKYNEFDSNAKMIIFTLTIENETSNLFKILLAIVRSTYKRINSRYVNKL